MKYSLAAGLVLLLSLTAVSSASAQDVPADPDTGEAVENAPAPAPAPAVQPVAAPAAAVSKAPLDIRRDNDASIDRNILVSSAETVGEGNFSFNSYQLILAGFTYGITQESQVSLTTLLPVVKDLPMVVLANGKLKVFQDDALIVSVQPALTVISKDDVTFGTIGGGVLVDYRLDAEAKAVLSASLLTSIPFAKAEGFSGVADGAIITLSAGIAYQVGDYVKLLGEFMLPAAYVWADDVNEFQVFEEGLLFNYGVRFYGKDLAVDLTFLRPMHPDVSSDLTDVMPMGIPYLTFSARF